MQNTTADYKIEINKPSRSFECKITIGNNIYTNEDLVNLTLEYTQPQEGFSIGGTISKSLDLTLINRGDIIYSTSQIKVEIGLKIGSKIEYILMGIFNIDDIEKTDYTTKFTAYDNMIKFETAYFSSLGDKPTLKQVVNELSKITGLEFTGSLPAYTVSKLDGFTCREVLSYVASICGGNAFITRDGKFTIKSLSEVDKSIDGNNYFNYTREEVKYKVGQISCQVDENNILSKGSIGTDSMELGFENQWVTETIIAEIYNKLNGLSYLGYSMKWQGDLSLDPYDIITVTDVKNVVRKIPILSQKITYTGGLTSEIGAKGETKNKNSFSSSGSTTNKVNRAVIEQAIIKEALIDKANIKDVEAVSIRTQTLEAKTAKIEEAIIDVAHIKDLNAINANIQNLIAADATINNALINKADITELNAVNGKINVLESDTANIKNLLAGNISGESGQLIHLTASNVVIADAVIKDLIAKNMSVEDLKASTISTNKFSIASTDGGLSIVGPTMQFKDKNNKVRIQMGQDTQGNFNFILRGADGTTTLIDHTGIKEKAIADNLIKENMVAADAIGEKQINYSSLITGLNKDTNTSLIKASKVAIDLTGQSLEVSFNLLKSSVDNKESRNLFIEKNTVDGYYSDDSFVSATTYRTSDYIEVNEGEIYTLCKFATDGYHRIVIFDKDKTRLGTRLIKQDTILKYAIPSNVKYIRLSIEKTHKYKVEKGENFNPIWTPAPEDVDSKIESNTTAITVAQGKIDGLIKESTITKGDITTLKDKYTSIKATVDGINTTVASNTSSIGTINNNISGLSGKVTTVENKQATLEQNLNGFKTTVGNTYSTKSELSGVDGKVSSLTSRVNTAESSITQLNNKISLKVEATEVNTIVNGAISKTAKSLDVMYYLSTSATSLAGGSWSTTAPTWTNGKYMWSKTVTTFVDGSKKESSPTCIAGATGANGSAGKGIKSIVEQYYLSISNTTQTGGSWVTSPPAWANGKYMWTRSIITYTDNSTTTTNPVCVSGSKGDTGAKGDKGATGAKGDTGVGISSVDVEYYLSTSATSLAGGSWSTTAPAWVNGKYMWSRTKTVTTTGATTYSNPVCITGAKGATGATGTKGDKGDTGNTGATGQGISSITEEYYLSTSKLSQTGGSWVTTPPTWSTGKYMWTRSKIVYKNPTSTAYTTPVCDSNWEAVNEVQVGGRNLIKDSNFIVQATASAFATTKPVVLVSGLDLNAIFLGKTVSFSYFVHNVGSKQNGSGSLGSRFGIHGSIQWKNSSTGATTTYYPFAECLDGVYKNTRVSMKYTFNPPSGYDTIAGFSFSFQPLSRPGSGNAEIWKIGQPKLEIGNKATDWSPAPEDVDSSIANVQTQVTTTSNKVATIETNLNSITQRVSSTESTTSSLTTKVNTAQSTADSKAKVFTSTPTVPYKIGDLWTGGPSGDVMRCKTARSSGSYTASDWEKASKYTDDTKANAAQSTANTANATANANKTEITTTKNKVATIETNVNSITSKVSSAEKNITTINGNVTNLQSRMNTAEQKITPTAITTTISSTISGGTGSISTTQFVMDKNGLTINNGALIIKNKAGQTVLNSDSNGNISIYAVGSKFKFTATGNRTIDMWADTGDVFTIKVPFYNLNSGFRLCTDTNVDLITAYAKNGDVHRLKLHGFQTDNIKATYMVASKQLYRYDDSGIYWKPIYTRNENAGIKMIDKLGIVNKSSGGLYMQVDMDGGGAYGIDIWSSDINLKKNIRELNSKIQPLSLQEDTITGLELIKKIKHYEFDYDETKGFEGHIDCGYISQQLQEINSSLVTEVQQEDGTILLQPLVSTLLPHMSKAIQEQQEKIEELENIILELKSRIGT